MNPSFHVITFFATNSPERMELLRKLEGYVGTYDRDHLCRTRGYIKMIAISHQVTDLYILSIQITLLPIADYVKGVYSPICRVVGQLKGKMYIRKTPKERRL